ncbi:Flp family type IVb pilin [Agromyces sp. MMS24-JH15]|uniref:Flp family type IVb pilin n=1 Tax=Agromyces sp. MMS24-JH15 TaxID=3243765 RepID=UPI00374A2A49
MRHLFASRRASLSRTASERGATAVEYGLILACIAAVIVVAVTALGTATAGAIDGVLIVWTAP